MYPSYSYESQLPGTQMNSFGQQGGSFSQQPLNPGSFGPTGHPGSFGQAGSFQQQQPLQAPQSQGQAGAQQWPQPRAQSHYVGSPTYTGPGPGGTKAPECEEDCAEEECDPDQCGDEQRAPNPENCLCGIDTRPLLPIALMISTFIAGVCMLVCQLPVLNSLIGGFEIVLGMFIAVFLILYLVTLGCMVYCAMADPGQLRGGYSLNHTAQPKRSHKTWLYRQPVRRYDHYCRWVTNCIGLLNHREFFLMCTGLVLIAVLGTAIDLVALIAVFSKGNWLQRIVVILHLIYSLILMALAGPILRIHVGLVSRNELASEWKRNEFYVVPGKHGENIPVNELSDDEFNNRFDTFKYDPRKNVFDRGCIENCWSFWCISRWPPSQMGEF